MDDLRAAVDAAVTADGLEAQALIGLAVSHRAHPQHAVAAAWELVEDGELSYGADGILRRTGVVS